MSSAARPLAPSVVPLTLALIAASPAAFAIEPLDTFNVRIGGYISTFDTQVRADGETTAGTEFDLERDLDMDSDNTVAMVGLTWRPFERHEFSFSFRQDDMDATTRLQRDIIFNDTVYPASATVRSDFSVDTYEASYVWWAMSHENWALGPRLGVVWYSMDLRLDLELDANGNPTTETISNDVSADLPEPAIGGAWRWTPAEQWRVSADAGYFSADVGDVDGDVFFGRAGVEWYPWESFGFWLDYTISDVDVDIDKTRYQGDFVFQDSGVRLGVAYRF